MTLGDVSTEEWDKLKELGFDLVWLMGVWKRSQAGRKVFQEAEEYYPLYESALPGWTEEDVIGSPYSIQAYEPDPLIGNWEELDRTRRELNNRRMGLILDFVPNHTGPDHLWVKRCPEYYIQGSEEDYRRGPSGFFPIKHKTRTPYIAKGRDPFFPPWPDTVQLNYFNPKTRSALIRQLKKIAQHCDGVRCDMAMLVLNEIFERTWGRALKGYQPPEREFWTEAISAVPGLILIAEAYWDKEWALQQLGFDYVYDKRLYDRLQAPAYDVYLHLKADMDFQRRLARFIENHDEPRSAAIFDKDRLKAAATLVATLAGLRFYHHGQLEGKRIRMPVQLRRARDEEPDRELNEFYRRLLSITDADAFHNGSWQLEEVTSAWDDSFHNLIGYTWRSEDRFKLVVVNLSPRRSQGRVPLTKGISDDKDYILVDELNDKSYLRSGREMIHPGLHVILEGYGAHIFDLSPS